jgi:SEC-C motif
MITVPQLKDERVPNLLALIKLNASAFFVPVVPDAWAKRNECFDNVSAKMQSDGGERRVGWQIWKHPFMLEAEYHAVWESPDGNLFDITPKDIKTGEILFVEDPTRPYDGQQLDNIRLNTTDNLLVNDFMALAETKFYLFSGGQKARMKIVTPTPNELEILKYIDGVMTGVDSLLKKGGVRNTACFCSSNMKYKHCHGKDLLAYLNTIRS